MNIDSTKSLDAQAWSLYNQAAQRHDDLIVIDYNRLGESAYLADRLSFLNCDPGFYNRYRELIGDHIHNESILKNKSYISKNSALDKLRFYTTFRLNKHVTFSKSICGDIVELSDK